MIFFTFCQFVLKIVKCSNYICSKDFLKKFAECKGIRGTPVLQVKVFRMAGDFFSERSKEDHEQWVRPPMTIQGHNPGQLSNLDD